MTATIISDFFREGGGEFYLLPHKSLSDGLRIANRKRTKTKGHPFVQMTVLPPTDTRQKIILLNHYCPVKAGKSVFEIVET